MFTFCSFMWIDNQLVDSKLFTYWQNCEIDIFFTFFIFPVFSRMPGLLRMLKMWAFPVVCMSTCVNSFVISITLAAHMLLAYVPQLLRCFSVRCNKLILSRPLCYPTTSEEGIIRSIQGMGMNCLSAGINSFSANGILYMYVLVLFAIGYWQVIGLLDVFTPTTSLKDFEDM